jgi:hypothetical protein
MAKFVKGQSGNPGGRPGGLGEIREIAREHTEPAIGILVAVMNDQQAAPSSRVAAATALLDRGWGRPAQTIDASINSHQSFVEALQEISERCQREQEAKQANAPALLAS